jgi:hypothetical protein
MSEAEEHYMFGDSLQSQDHHQVMFPVAVKLLRRPMCVSPIMSLSIARRKDLLGKQRSL